MTSRATEKPARSKSARRLWMIAGCSVLGLAVVFVLLVFILPSPAARYAIEYQLDRLGIQHDGIDSVTIDLWDSEVTAGPVTFRSGDAGEGQLGEAGFRYSLANLFEKRAFIEAFFLRGINLAIKRHEDGPITINGVDLAQFAAAEDPNIKEPSAPAEEEGAGFEVGIDSFEFADSQVVFEDFTGGSLTLDLERLLLSGFHSWEPEAPGKFELEGKVNDISVKLQGTATPFADPVVIALQTSLRDATIDKIAVFTGPTGLTRQDGNFESDVTYDFTIHQDGRQKGTIDGEFRLHDVHIATEDGGTVAFDQARLVLDLVREVAEDGSKSLGGNLDIEIAAATVGGPGGEGIALNEITFNLADLDFRQLTEKREIEEQEGSPETENPAAARTIVELLLSNVEAYARQALSHEIEMSGTPSLTAGSGQFTLPGGKDGPDQEIRFTAFSAQAPGIESQTVADGWTITASFDALLNEAWAGAAGQDQKTGITANGGQVKAQSIAVQTDQSGTTITFDVATSLQRVALQDATGMTMTLGAVTAGTPGMTVAGKSGESHISGPVQIGIEEIESNLASEEGNLALAGKAFSFDAKQFDLGGHEELVFALAGALEISDLTIAKDGEEPLAAKLETAQIALKSLRVEPIGPGATVETALSAKLAALQLSRGPTETAQKLAVNDIDISVDSLKAKTSGALSLSLSGSTTLNGIQSALPLAGGEALQANVGQVNLQASEVTFDLGGQEELALALAGALEISDLTLAKDGEEPLAVELETGHIDLKSLRVDSIGPGGATVETALAAKLAALQVSQGSAKAAQKLTIDSTDIGVDSLNVKTSEPLSLSLSGSTTFSGTKGALPLAGGKTLQANVGQVNLQAVEIILEGEAFRSAVDIAATGITIRTDEELPQIIDLKGLTVEGLKVDPAQQIEIAAITVDQLNAEINEGILALGGKGAADSKKDDGADEGAPPPLRLGRVSISKGSTIKVSNNSIEPPMKLEITIENAEVGPIDTGALDTQTEIDLGTAINKEADIKVLGWASPLLPTPDFDLTAEVSKLPLPPFSPYVGSAVGMNIDSGILNVVAKANVDAGALKGQIDVLVDELYLEPVSAESEEGFESSYGVSANFAAGILKNDKGQIDLSFPVSGSVEEPEIDYSEVISKAIGGAMAALFPLNWFGDDESSFEILPATFDVGTADLTDAGEEAGDKVGALLADELQLSIRICGKATASDLIVLRGGEPPEEVTEAEAVEQEGIASEEAAEEDGVAAEPPQRVEKPSEQEVDQLLKLAIQRSEVVRQYLTSNFNINTSRMSECRTSYSIEDSKPPRAEFRF